MPLYKDAGCFQSGDGPDIGCMEALYVAPTPTGGTKKNYYVTYAGGVPSQSGDDWTNAMAGLPSFSPTSTQYRGATFYIAGDAVNTYSPVVFDEGESDTDVITIRKATAANSGNIEGWQASYGTEQAVWDDATVPTAGYWGFNSGYWYIDGVYRDSDWEDGYGFKIDPSTADGGYGIWMRKGNTQNALPGITIRYTHYDGIQDGNGPWSPWQAPCYGIAVNTGDNLDRPITATIEYCAFTDCYIPWSLKTGATGWTFQYNYVNGNFSSDSHPVYGTHHGACASLYWICDYADGHNTNTTIRYNKILNIGGTAVLNAHLCEGLAVYGNLFACTFPAGKVWQSPSNGMVYSKELINGTYNGQCHGLRFYNNTMAYIQIHPDLSSDPDWVTANCVFSQPGVSMNHGSPSYGTDNRAWNNVYYHCCDSGRTGEKGIINIVNGTEEANEHDWNWYFGYLLHGSFRNQSGGSPIETNVEDHGNVTDPGIFADSDYRLSSPTNSGVELGAPYTYDMDGIMRGVDIGGAQQLGNEGVWDRGAFEYDSGGRPSFQTGGQGSITLNFGGKGMGRHRGDFF
jgi:hypothetical protein